MKVAIYFSGRIHTKNFEEIKCHLNKLKSRYDIKFFCSLNQNTLDEYTTQFCKEFEIDEKSINLEPTIIPNEIHNYRKFILTNYDNTYSMFYHNNRATQLIEKYENETGHVFDVIVKYRGDIITNDIMEIHKPDDNTVYIPKDKDFGGINDQIAYGSKETMKKYASCIDKINQYCKSGVVYHPEILLLRHLKSNELIIKRYDYDYRLCNSRHKIGFIEFLHLDIRVVLYIIAILIVLTSHFYMLRNPTRNKVHIYMNFLAIILMMSYFTWKEYL